MPTPYNGNERDLIYLLNKSLVPYADTPQTPTILNHPFTWPTTDNDERVNILLNLSLNEYIALSSCVDVGSDIAYGEDAILMWWIWVRSVLSTDPEATLSETGDCYAYPLYAPFISYSPMNPYNEPGEIPDGYLASPFYVYDGMGSLPSAYQAGDIIVPYSAITLDPFDVFGGNLPTIQIQVVGDGQIELDLLAMGLGSLVAVSLNGSPSLGDILAGIFSEGTTVIDTNLDIASLPAEDDVSIQHEIDIVAGTGVTTTVFLTFMPIIDDSLFLPLRFGGGLRSVQLCGFESGGVIMGITDIRINNCEIEKFENGSWTPIDGSLQDCIDTVGDALQAQIDSNDTDITNLQNADVNLQNQITSNDDDIADIELSILGLNATDVSLQNQINTNDTELADHETRITALESSGGGGSGSGQNIKTTAYEIEILANYDNTSTVFATACSIAHEFTYANAMIIVEAKCQSANNSTQARIRISTPSMVGILEGWATGVSPVSTQVSQVFESHPLGASVIYVDLATSVNGNYARLNTNQRVQVSIIEYSTLSTPLADYVTFDAGGMAYTLPPGQVGALDTNGVGNPDNCLRALNAILNDYAEVEIDLGSQQTITEIEYHVWLSQVSAVDIQLFVDGNLIETNDLNNITQSVWNAKDWTSQGIGLPIAGTIVKLRLLVNFDTTVSDMRLDNVKVVY